MELTVNPPYSQQRVDVLQIIELRYDIAQLATRVAVLEDELAVRDKIVKMPEAQRILKMSWCQVKARMDRGIIPYTKRGTHFFFKYSELVELACNPRKLQL